MIGSATEGLPDTSGEHQRRPRRESTRRAITVVMANYNHAAFVGEALDSILSQSLSPTEVIVVDDASTDGSQEVLRSFGRRYAQVRIQEEPINTGLRAHCRRVGEAASSGTSEYFYMASADDKLLPEFFSRAVEALEAHPQAGFAAAYPTYVGPDGAPALKRTLPGYHTHAKHVGDIKSPRFFSPNDLLTRLARQPWFINGTVAVLFRTSALTELGPPDVSLGLLADWFMVHAVGLRQGMCYIPEPLVAFRIMPDSWGSSFMNRPDMAIRQYALVLSRMRQPEWCSVFPDSFVEAKRREFSYGLLRSALVNWQNNYLQRLRELLPPTTGRQRVLLRIFRWVSLFQWVLLKLYCHGCVAPALAESRAFVKPDVA
jgi:glycosyltransferase involved in cell wall biosynthesis